jgi:uncharacterized Tic20 family protein
MAEANDTFRAEPPPPERRSDWTDEPSPDAAEKLEPTSDEKTMCILAHLGGFVLWFIAPLIVWSMYKDKSRFVAEHAKEALNFQVTLGIYWLFLCIIFPVLIVYEIVFVILAVMAANRGEMYHIPLNIRFIK